MTDFIDHPVFICGHPKAGTSLISSLLDGHPAIVAYPEETLFFRRFLPAITGKSSEEFFNLADELLLHIFDWNRENPPEHHQNYPDCDYSDIDVSAVREEFRSRLRSGKKSKRTYLDVAVLAYGKVTGILTPESHLWVEKMPYNEFYTEEIFKWWPKAKCIHIVCDAMDNYVSYRRKHSGWSAKNLLGIRLDPQRLT